MCLDRPVGQKNSIHVSSVLPKSLLGWVSEVSVLVAFFSICFECESHYVCLVVSTWAYIFDLNLLTGCGGVLGGKEGK